MVQRVDLFLVQMHKIGPMGQSLTTYKLRVSMVTNGYICRPYDGDPAFR